MRREVPLHHHKKMVLTKWGHHSYRPATMPQLYSYWHWAGQLKKAARMLYKSWRTFIECSLVILNRLNRNKQEIWIDHIYFLSTLDMTEYVFNNNILHCYSTTSCLLLISLEKACSWKHPAVAGVIWWTFASTQINNYMHLHCCELKGIFMLWWQGNVIESSPLSPRMRSSNFVKCESKCHHQAILNVLK